MSYEINWSASGGDPVLSTPQYQKWSQYTIGELEPLILQIKTELKGARASRESQAVINYLSWLIRTVGLVG